MIEKINSLIKTAMFAHDAVTRDILRLLKSEISKEEEKARDLKRDFSNEDMLGIVRKMIKNNEFTLKVYLDKILDSSEQQCELNINEKNSLLQEIKILKSLLPTAISKDELINFINDKKIDFSKCKMEGQFVGAILKETKKEKIIVEIGIVKELAKSFETAMINL